MCPVLNTSERAGGNVHALQKLIKKISTRHAKENHLMKTLINKSDEEC